MFKDLVESGSHRRELARKSRFFLGTLGLYGLLLAAAGVASVQAYNARLGTHNYEIVFLPPAVIPDAERPPDTPARARPASGATDQIDRRTAAYTDLKTAVREPPPISTERVTVPPVQRDRPWIIANDNYTPNGPVGPRTDGPAGYGTRPAGVLSDRLPPMEDLAPVARATPAPTPAPPTRVSVPSHILSGKVLSKPVPAYPIIAKQARAQGPVMVEILVDEAGSVVSARATGGHQLLRVAAERAALAARFTPTVLNGRPVKVSGVITYNFVLN
jgi:protein TonB